jgi:hypothetical protein
VEHGEVGIGEVGIVTGRRRRDRKRRQNWKVGLDAHCLAKRKEKNKKRGASSLRGSCWERKKDKKQ